MCLLILKTQSNTSSFVWKPFASIRNCPGVGNLRIKNKCDNRAITLELNVKRVSSCLGRFSCLVTDDLRPRQAGVLLSRHQSDSGGHSDIYSKRLLWHHMLVLVLFRST